jgi:hypothetical protein
MFEWARHQLTDDGLLGAMLYGTSVTLLGLARGKAATELETLVREHQLDAALRIPGSPEASAVESGGSEAAAE